MSIYEQFHYKENGPEITIERLVNILKECGIEVEETWPLTSSINTYSLRVSIKGTNIGTNGKGVTKNYARASAYAEFFERFQNNILGHTIPNTELPYIIANDEKFFSAFELLKDNNAYVDFYFSERGMKNTPLEERVKQYEDVNRFDKEDQYGGKYLSLPFYSVRDKKIVYLPYSSYSAMYGSNGMSAGNSPEEALVQGLSEIVERIVQKKIFLEKPTFPDIPEEYIKKYPYIYEMYKKACADVRYRVFLKDCSFGGKYPVVALCIIEKNTGRYGVKLGCHPNIAIAMERTFTEVTQGIDIFEYSKQRSWFDFSNSNVDTDDNISNSYKIGLSQYPYQFFSKKADYAFTETKNVSGCSNAEIINDWILNFIPEYDILIRDVSFTGFPSYHILIPGLSEMQKLSDYDIRARNTRSYVAYLLTHTEEINPNNVKYIIGVLKMYSNSIFENSLSTYFPPDYIVELPYDSIGSDIYLLAMCYIVKGDYEEALNCIKVVQQRAKNSDLEQRSKEIITCLFYYLSGMCEMHSHEKVMEYLYLFFSDDICEIIHDIFANPKKVIMKQYEKIIKDKLPYYEDFRVLLAKKYVNIKINQQRIAKIFNQD